MTVYPIHVDQGCCGVTRRARGAHFSGAKSSWGASNDCGSPKSPNIVIGTFFNAVHLLPKDLRFEHCGARLASCSGCNLTSLRPCRGGQTFWPEGRIRDCLATAGSATVRFKWQTAVNAVALLSPVGNVAIKKKFARYLPGRINWVAGRMRLTGRSLATAHVDYEEKCSDSTHPCRSPTPTVNGRDLTPLTRSKKVYEVHILGYVNKFGCYPTSFLPGDGSSNALSY